MYPCLFARASFYVSAHQHNTTQHNTTQQLEGTARSLNMAFKICECLAALAGNMNASYSVGTEKFLELESAVYYWQSWLHPILFTAYFLYHTHTTDLCLYVESICCFGISVVCVCCVSMATALHNLFFERLLLVALFSVRERETYCQGASWRKLLFDWLTDWLGKIRDRLCVYCLFLYVWVYPCLFARFFLCFCSPTQHNTTQHNNLNEQPAH